MFDPLFDRIFNWMQTWGQSPDDVKFDQEFARIMNARPDELLDEVSAVIKEWGSPSSNRFHPTVEPGIFASIPPVLFRFFENYEKLSFGEGDRSIDRKLVHLVVSQGKQYLVIGAEGDDSEFAAISMQGTHPVVLLSYKDGQIELLEKIAPSIEHYILLRHILNEHAASLLNKPNSVRRRE